MSASKMKLTLRVWRQKNKESKGKIVEYQVNMLATFVLDD